MNLASNHINNLGSSKREAYLQGQHLFFQLAIGLHHTVIPLTPKRVATYLN